MNSQLYCFSCSVLPLWQVGELSLYFQGNQEIKQFLVLRFGTWLSDYPVFDDVSKKVKDKRKRLFSPVNGEIKALRR